MRAHDNIGSAAGRVSVTRVGRSGGQGRACGVGSGPFVDLLLGVGVIGLGSAGTRHARNLAEGRVPGARLAAVCDPVNERRREFAVPGFADAGALLAHASVDALVIATPHRLHIPLSRAALADTYRMIEQRIGALTDLPLAGLDRAELQNRLQHVTAGEGPAIVAWTR